MANLAVTTFGEILVIGAIGRHQTAVTVVTAAAAVVYFRIARIDKRRRIAVAAGAAGRIDLDQGVMVRCIGRMDNIPVQRVASDAITAASRKARPQLQPIDMAVAACAHMRHGHRGICCRSRIVAIHT